MVAAATIGAAALGVVGSMAAANKQSSAANKATDLQGQIYQQNQANLQPYMGFGGQSMIRLADLLGVSGNAHAPGYGSLTSGFTPADFLANKDPGYDFQLRQGQQALQSSQSAGNGVLTGSSLKDLLAFNQGFAATGYQNAFDRWQAQQNNIYQRLMQGASLGENAAAGVGNMGVQTGANMAGTITGAGNAAASGIVGATNALSGGANNAAAYYWMSQNSGNPLLSSGFMGNDSSGYTNVAPWDVGPPAPFGGS